MMPSFFPAIGLILLVPGLFSAPLSANPDTNSTIARINTRIEAAPNNQYLYIQRSLTWSGNNDPQKALQDIEMAERMGDPLDAAFAHGILLYRSAQFEAARGYFDSYLNAYPQHIQALEYRARLLRDAGEPQAAIVDYQLLFTLSPVIDAGHYLSVARMMRQQPEQYDVATALAVLDQRMAEIGVISQLQRYAIELEQERGDYPAAMARMGTLDQKLRATPKWQIEMAELLLLEGDPRQAVQFLGVADSQLQSARQTRHNIELRRRLDQLTQQIQTLN